MHFPILTSLVALPVAGATLLLLVRGDEERTAPLVRNIALIVSLLVFAETLLLWSQFHAASGDFQFVERHAWIPAFGIEYYVGVDGISLLLLVLTGFLTPLALLSSWESVHTQTRAFCVFILLLESAMMGVFISLDLFLFYIFWDAMLVPMYFLIGIWGYERRVYAAIKFILYTMAGSVLMLLAILGLAYMHYTATGAYSFDLLKLYEMPIELHTQFWFFLAFALAFAIKVPLFPFHTWLPDAHVEAPTAGSVILAGVLLKMGGYGFIRFSIPLMPEASQYFAPLVFGLSCIAVIYTSLVALVQEDMKKLIAYSSVAHMGLVTIGIFVMNTQGVEGSIFQMLSHGIVSAALFLCVGVVYDRMHTREIAAYGGLVHRMPRYAFTFLFFTLASVGLPGLSGFIGEFLVLIGAFKANTWVAFLAATGLILGAAYALWLYRKIMFGELVKDSLKGILDMDRREIVIFLPLVLLTIWMGVYPNSFLDPIAPSVDKLIGDFNAAIKLAHTASLR